MLRFLSNLRARKRAYALAEKACLVARPQEPIFGAQIYENKPDHFIVRVFCGRRPLVGYRMPPWNECLVFTVAKGTDTIEEITDGQYQPVLR